MYIRFKINVTARLIMLRLHTDWQQQQQEQSNLPESHAPASLLLATNAATAAHAQTVGLHLMAWAISGCRQSSAPLRPRLWLKA